MKTLTGEYLDTAAKRLHTASAIVAQDPAAALSIAYYAGLYAARGSA